MFRDGHNECGAANSTDNATFSSVAAIHNQRIQPQAGSRRGSADVRPIQNLKSFDGVNNSYGNERKKSFKKKQ
jgi:hypothetical protein